MILQFFFLQINIYQYCICMLTPMYFLKNHTDSIIPLQLQASWQRVTWTTYTLDSERLEPKDMVLRHEEYNPYTHVQCINFGILCQFSKMIYLKICYPTEGISGSPGLCKKTPCCHESRRCFAMFCPWRPWLGSFSRMGLFGCHFSGGKHPGRWKMAPKIIFILENEVSSHDLFWSGNSVKS